MATATTTFDHLNIESKAGQRGDSVAEIADTLTDNSGGTASTTLADITEANNAGSADRVPTENAIASLAAQVNTLIARVNSLADALENAGIVKGSGDAN